MKIPDSLIIERLSNRRTCKKCNHLCHCIEADHEGCKCTGCDSDREYYPRGIVRSTSGKPA